jgi:outer membrane PBP1 activator LpoA protein
MFADTPWTIDPQPWIEQLPAQFAEHWPEEKRRTRLHAMGYDAYNLIAWRGDCLTQAERHWRPNPGHQ